VNRREIYARITLVDGVPSPKEITLYEAGVVASEPAIVLVFDTLGEGVRWVEWLGGSPVLHLNPDGYTYLRHEPIEWLGCDVRIHAHQKLDDVAPALDEATRERLEQLVDEPIGEDREVVTGPAALSGSQQELVDGEVYDREEPEPDGKPLPPGVSGFAVGDGPRRGLPFADLAPSTVVIRG
jgi:hypothetical protein